MYLAIQIQPHTNVCVCLCDSSVYKHNRSSWLAVFLLYYINIFRTFLISILFIYLYIYFEHLKKYLMLRTETLQCFEKKIFIRWSGTRRLFRFAGDFLFSFFIMQFKMMEGNFSDKYL